MEHQCYQHRGPSLLSTPAPRLTGASVLIAAGRRDPYAPVARVEALATLFRESGAAVDLRWSDRGHELDPGEIDQTAAWLAGQPQDR